MNNLATKNISDFTVLDNGDAFISQRKAALLCGVSHTTIQNWVATLDTNNDGLLSHNSLLEVATKAVALGRSKAIEFITMLAKAGAKAYIYHEAGYMIEAKNTLPDFTNPAIAARVWADEVEQKQVLQEQAKMDAPKIEFAMAVRNMEGACSISDFAKTIGTGRNRLLKQLRGDMVLMKNNRPYQRYCDSALFVVIEQIPFTDSKGKSHPSFTTMVTGKGQVWLEKKYRDAAA